MGDPKEPDLSAVVEDAAKSSYANVLSEQAALILLSEQIQDKLKEQLKVNIQEKKYRNFSTDRTNNVGHFHITNNLTKVRDMQSFFHKIPNSLLSYLIPNIKLYKCIYNHGNAPRYDENAKKNYKMYDWRIPFDDIPTSFGDDTSEFVENAYQEILQGRGRLHGAGIKSFNYEYVGTNPAEVNTNIKCTLELYFQSIEDITKEITIYRDDSRLNKKPDGDFKNNTFSYSDLLNQSARSKKDNISKELIPNEFYYRIKAVVGYSPVDVDNFDDLALEAFKSIGNESGYKDANEYIKGIKRAISKTKLILFLTPYSHSLNFNEDGTLGVKIDYHATVDKVLNSEQADVLKISSAYYTYLQYKNKLEETLNRKQAFIDKLDSDCNNKSSREAREAAINKEFSKDALELLNKEFLGARSNLYSAVYQKIVGLEKIESGQDIYQNSGIYKVEIKTEVLGVNNEESAWKFGKWDPEGKALEYNVLARLQALGEGQLIKNIERISVNDLEKADEEKLLLMQKAQLASGDFQDTPQSKAEGGTAGATPPPSASAETPIPDPELYAYLKDKTVLVIGDQQAFSQNTGFYDILWKNLSGSGAKSITKFNINDSAFADYFFDYQEQSFRYKQQGPLLREPKYKADIVISFIGTFDANRLLSQTIEENNTSFTGYPHHWSKQYIQYVNKFSNKWSNNEVSYDDKKSNYNYYLSDIFYVMPPKLKDGTPTKFSLKTFNTGEEKKILLREDNPQEKELYGFRNGNYNLRLKALKDNLKEKLNTYNNFFYDSVNAVRQAEIEAQREQTNKAGLEFKSEIIDKRYIAQYKLSNINELLKPSVVDDTLQLIEAEDDSNADNSYLISQQQSEIIVKKIIMSMKKKNELKTQIINGQAGVALDDQHTATGTEEGMGKLLENASTKFVKLSPDSGYVKVKFLLLGDMLDTALECMKNLYPKEIIPRIILGQIDITIPQRYRGTTYQDTRSDTNKITLNLADVPVSIDLFQTFMINKLVKPQRLTYTAMSFIKDIISDLIVPSVSPAIFGESAALNNQIRFSTLALTIPARDDGTDPIFNKTAKSVSTSAYEPLTQKMFSNFQNYLENTNISDIPKNTVDYLFIYCSSQMTKNVSGDIEKDENNHIMHFRIATDKGIVKKINFSVVQGGFIREAVAMQEGKERSSIIKQVYNADITMFGNNIFRPGDFLYIEPIFAFGINETDLQDKIGLGGYYQVINVKTDINENAFETSLKCVFYAHRTKDGVVPSSTRCPTPVKPPAGQPALTLEEMKHATGAQTLSDGTQVGDYSA